MSDGADGRILRGIVSGGQTGVDRAALDFALERGIPCGGWCPYRRRAEDGRIPEHYPLQQTHDIDYAQRTEFNVRDSDGTLILSRGKKLTGGTLLTATCARRMAKPLLVVDLDFAPDYPSIRDWFAVNEIRTLNIAGPRESQSPGIAERTAAFLSELSPP